MYFVPSVESIEKSNDIEQPARPASPEPIPNVILSIFLVLIPRHCAILLFCIVALILEPKLVLYISNQTPTRQKIIITIMKITSPVPTLPCKNEGAFTLTGCAPNMLRANCCKIRLTPHVASKLSISFPYNLETINFSIITPIAKATPKAAKRATM